MSDIPPELLEEVQPFTPPDDGALYEADVRWIGRAMLVFAVVIFLLFVRVSRAHAATYEPSSTYCELFAQDPDNGRYYIVEDPPWTPTCAHPWVTVRADKFLTLVQAYEAASPASGASAPASQFTPDEVAALKTQAAVGLTVQIEPKPASPQTIIDMTTTFGLMFLALIGIWGGRQLKKVFDHTPNDPG